MTQPITIRPAGAHDVPAIQRIYNREILEGVATLDEWPWTDARRRAWLETYRDEMVIVAQGDETVVGFAHFTPMQKFGFRFTREVTVYVDSTHHRGGVGRQLIEALIEGARERNLHVLVARITSENSASLALFEALGFERTALRPEWGYKFGRWVDIVEMQLTLQTTEELERLVQPGFRVALVATPEEMQEALAVRRAVFIEEQLIDEDEEIDRYDADPTTVTDAVHVLGRLDGRPVATARLLLDQPAGEYPHIGRVAVLQSERGRYWGVGVMQALHEEAHRRGHAGVTLGAQEYAVGFYAKLGYVARGEVFLDAGIEHRWMDLVFEGAEGGTT
ncbi:MAG: GNAT family N-acetyltransferase [Chloroflexi bacterium]|nr:GNAT family N-acetyltransferase [Chloroflexota bacterium]